MDYKTFKGLVVEGIDALPSHILKLLDNVVIVIRNNPSAVQIKEHQLAKNETLYGLYEGVPLTERNSDYGFMLPDKITIFKNPILETYTELEDIRTCVANTVWHEVAHHFGFDEEWVQNEEIKRNKTL